MSAHRSSGLAFLPILGYLAIAAVVAAVVAPPPKGGKAAWYSVRSWGKHAPADHFDQAKQDDFGAGAVVNQQREGLIHSAAIEVDKAKRAIPSLPPSPATDVVKRTIDNAAGALQQVSPLSAAESQANFALVLGLLSAEVAARQKAELQQDAVEKDLMQVSIELEKARLAKAETEKKLTEAGVQLRQGFEERNALANELEAGKAKRTIMYFIIGALVLAVIYAKVALGGVGRVLGTMDESTFKTYGDRLNQELSAVGQWAIRSGRLGAAKVKAAKEALTKGVTPETT